MDYYEMKKLRNSLTTHTKTETHTVPILLTYNTYSDAGPDYEQRTRYAKSEDLEKLQLKKCVRCGRLMDGGKCRNDLNKQMCYICAKETTLEECFNLIDIKAGKKPKYNINYDW